jgi:hypothetical protein
MNETPTQQRPRLFYKRPLSIEAMQWDGTPEGATPIIDWVLGIDGCTASYHDAEPPRMHSIHCSCDGRGVVSGSRPFGTPLVACPETEPQGPGREATISVQGYGYGALLLASDWLTLNEGGMFFSETDEVFSYLYMVEGS